jgi:hypothetical protein
MRKYLYFFLLLTGCGMQSHETHSHISLEGVWQFRIDSLNEGIENQWFNDQFDQTIVLPGSMAENGYGDEVTLFTKWTGSIWDSSYFEDPGYEKYRQQGNIKIPFWLKPLKYYTGPAWYQKDVTVPGKWEGKRVILSLERCHWESRVYINGREAGTVNSLAVAHQYDVTPLIKTGKNRISIRIDNRMIIPVGENSHSVSDHTQTNWNGIIGAISLDALAPVHVKNIQVFPDLHSHDARVVLTIANHSGVPFEGTLEMQAKSYNSEKKHTPAPLSRSIAVPGQEETVELVYSMGGESLLWSEFSPALYRLEVKLNDSRGHLMDQQSQEFGMREFGVNGTRFMVNGRPVFLRGTLECCIFPLTGYPPTDEAAWLHLIGRCKEHGLNHLRFHSWCPPEAAFRAADKMGFYLQVECGSWANQGSTIGDGSPLDSFIYQEGDRILEAYGNHPSFCMMAYGNEPAGEHQEQYLGRLVDYWKSKDSRRVYTSAAGWPFIPENQYHNDPMPRIQHWEEGVESVINARPPQTSFDYREVIGAYDIPVVSHEIGQWCVYPDFREIKKYTGVLKPTNFEIFQETLQENHMGHQAEDFLMASGKLQAICYKAEIEAALRTPGFAGFQLLQLHDFPGQGTALVGILDPFFNSKGYITPEAFRKFCNRTVPLARMEKRIFTSGEVFRAEIELSHFGEVPLTGQKIRCLIRNTDHDILFDQMFEIGEIPIGNVIPAGSIQYELDGISRARKLTLEVGIENTPYANSWDFWVYPQNVHPDPGEVIITQKLDKATVDLLRQGRSVLLLTYGSVNEKHGANVRIGFSSIFWNTAWTRGQAPHTLGILCDPAHPVFKDFPTEYHSNWQWWDPVTHSQAMILDEFPAMLSPLIQPIDTWFKNRKLALAFEARSGGGRIMVCSIDLGSDLGMRPASCQLLNSMLNYMNSSDFDPETEVDPEIILRLSHTIPGSG